MSRDSILGSAAFGRPITLRLARDFVHVPADILDKRGVRRMFTEVAVIWGFSRIVDVALNLGFLHRGVDAGLWARGLLSPLLTVLAVAGGASLSAVQPITWVILLLLAILFLSYWQTIAAYPSNGGVPAKPATPPAADAPKAAGSGAVK